MWENGEVISKSFKIIQKLPLLKKKKNCVCKNSLSLKNLREGICVFSSLWKWKWRNIFFFSPRKPRKNTIFLSEETKVLFLLEVLFFSMKTKVKALVLWEKNGFHICSFIHDLRGENWLVKQSIWILGILEGNWEALFFIGREIKIHVRNFSSYYR